MGIGCVVAALCHVSTQAARQQFSEGKHSRFAAEQSRKLLYTLIPPNVLARLAKHSTQTEQGMLSTDIPHCTILFCKLTAEDVVDDMAKLKKLDKVYCDLDSAVMASNLYKYQHVGPWYILACPNAAAPFDDHELSEGGADKDQTRAHKTYEEEMGVVAKRLVLLAHEHGIKVQIGLHTGAAAGAVVGKLRAFYCILGESVNLASRLCAHARNGEICVSQGFVDGLRRQQQQQQGKKKAGAPTPKHKHAPQDTAQRAAKDTSKDAKDAAAHHASASIASASSQSPSAQPPKLQQQQQQQQGRHVQQQAPMRKPPAPAPVQMPAARAAQQPIPAYAAGATQATPDFDVEAVALSAIGASGMTGMGIDEDDIMAMALGMDPPHQDWNVSSQSAMPTSNYHHSTQPFAGYEPFQSAGVASAGYAASYETTGFGSDTAAYEDAGSAAGSRLFERWAGQGLGGGPASSRLTSFVGDGAQAMSNAMSSGGAGANGAFAGALSYNGFQGDDGSAGNEQHHLPLGRGARRLG
eukprot:Tamp_13330.p1 GENE.Tamp_13330~~Tamp_13330.p1  ORF type:complete len:524 (-),score=135.78 Tamp_13330:157-1728(-)